MRSRVKKPTASWLVTCYLHTEQDRLAYVQDREWFRVELWEKVSPHNGRDVHYRVIARSPGKAVVIVWGRKRACRKLVKFWQRNSKKVEVKSGGGDQDAQS